MCLTGLLDVTSIGASHNLHAQATLSCKSLVYNILLQQVLQAGRQDKLTQTSVLEQSTQYVEWEIQSGSFVPVEDFLQPPLASSREVNHSCSVLLLNNLES